MMSGHLQATLPQSKASLGKTKCVDGSVDTELQSGNFQFCLSFL